VASVERNGAAYAAGLRPGNVIEEVNRQSVESLADFQRITGQLKEGQDLLLKVWHQGMRHFILVKR